MMPTSQTFSNLQESKLQFLKVRLFLNEDAKNNRNRSNLFCRKTQLKNITNAFINSFE